MTAPTAANLCHHLILEAPTINGPRLIESGTTQPPARAQSLKCRMRLSPSRGLSWSVAAAGGEPQRAIG